MSDTPETDAIYAKGRNLSDLAYEAEKAHARKLETERDGLRQRVANLEYSNEQHRLQAESWRAAAVERDELRAEVERLKAACGQESAQQSPTR